LKKTGKTIANNLDDSDDESARELLQVLQDRRDEVSLGDNQQTK